MAAAAAAQIVEPKPPDGGKAEGQGRDTAPTNIIPTSYADRLKTNVRYDHRLKRNVLEITIEKSDKDARIDLEPGMVARILNSIGLDIGNQVEGYQIFYGRVCLISVWVVQGVLLDRFCQKENIIVTKGVVTGSIRPAGRRDVIVTFAGVDYNTPDTLIQEYIKKFGGKLMSQNVSYGRYSEGPFIGKINNERKYQVDFSDSKKKMGTYHFLDGSRIRVFYRGNEKTCGRCHHGQSECPGGGIAKECEKKGGARLLLTDHMRKLWTEINFAPTSFELPEEAETEEVGEDVTKNGDRPISDTRVPAVKKPEITAEAKEKLTGLRINNLPLDMTEEEVVKFLKEHVKPGIESVNIEMSKNDRNTQVFVFSGVEPDLIVAAIAKIDFKETKEKFLGRPLYCKPVKNLTPTKQPVSEEAEKLEGSEPAVTKTATKGAVENTPRVTQRQMQLAEAILESKTPAKQSKSSNGIAKFFTPRPATSMFAQQLENGEISPINESLDSELMSTPAGTDKRNASQLSPTSPASTAPSKKTKELKKPSGIPVGFGAMSGPK
jgi:hypothetical protein